MALNSGVNFIKSIATSEKKNGFYVFWRDREMIAPLAAMFGIVQPTTIQEQKRRKNSSLVEVISSRH
mgnify:CR=1 FL=1